MSHKGQFLVKTLKQYPKNCELKRNILINIEFSLFLDMINQQNDLYLIVKEEQE